jgi:plastocyanin
MKKPTLLMFLTVMLVAIGSAASAVAAAAPQTVSITIRHQMRGCHAWSVNGGPFAASHAIALARGGAIRFTNNDVMPHTLIRVSGPSVRMRNSSTMPMGMGMHRAAPPGVMNHMGATTTAFLTRAGTYVFKTRAGEDYMAGMRTIGEDNVLRLTVTVR